MGWVTFTQGIYLQKPNFFIALAPGLERDHKICVDWIHSTFMN